MDDEDRTRPMGGLGEGAALRALPQKPVPHYTRRLVPALAMASGAMLGFAAPDLIEADGIVDYLKAGVLAVSGGLVAYGTLRLAVERGTRQAAIGTPGAAVVSIGAILMVGTALATSTYAGLTKAETERLLLEAYDRDQAAHIAERVTAAQATRRIGPAMAAVETTLAETARCERASNCVSGGSVTGAGPVFQVITGEAQEAGAIAAQIREGSAAFDAASTRLGDLQARYGEIVADESLSASARRIGAQGVASEVAAALSALEEAAPVSLAIAYAEGLKTPVVIAGRPEASVRWNVIRSAQAARLDGVTGGIARSIPAPPVFPGKAGVSDTVAAVGHFLPIALIVGVVELAFPLLLWLTTYFGYLGQIVRPDHDPAPPTRARKTGRPRKTA